ncbi:hypothetical protein [Ferruginibacter albus]|uniref:hypothetical protein n=1 Tax=Ferruginibacter albus TaxID=2875540 RepID=UPI001CC36F39|nr:hypothetical protein [Ferruginibacter albus]UAY52012.1 hypothetical protein K9M53_15640 [Ferruginibacter albus]
MRWVLVSGPNAALQEFHLLQNDECIVVLKYNPLHRSARVISGQYQRLFFMQSAGALTGKNIFMNEYGLEVGSLTSEKWGNNGGTLIIEEKKFTYKVQNSSELTVSDSAQHSTSCNLKPESIDNNYLLLGLCWYLHLPVVKEKLEYAA